MICRLDSEMIFFSLSYLLRSLSFVFFSLSFLLRARNDISFGCYDGLFSVV